MNKHCLSKNIPLLSKSLLLKIIMVTSELSQRGTGLLEGYYFTKRSDISFRISIFRSIEISSYRTIGFQFFPPRYFPVVHPRQFIRRFFPPPPSLPTILEHTSLARREDTVRMRAAVKDGRLVELLRMACSSFLSSQLKQPLPSVCLFPAGLNVTLNDQFPCETNRTVTGSQPLRWPASLPLFLNVNPLSHLPF